MAGLTAGRRLGRLTLSATVAGLFRLEFQGRVLVVKPGTVDGLDPGLWAVTFTPSGAYATVTGSATVVDGEAVAFHAAPAALLGAIDVTATGPGSINYSLLRGTAQVRSGLLTSSVTARIGDLTPGAYTLFAASADARVAPGVSLNVVAGQVSPATFTLQPRLEAVTTIPFAYSGVAGSANVRPLLPGAADHELLILGMDITLTLGPGEVAARPYPHDSYYWRSSLYIPDPTSGLYAEVVGLRLQLPPHSSATTVTASTGLRDVAGPLYVLPPGRPLFADTVAPGGLPHYSLTGTLTVARRYL